jgi:hypothetical protein
MNRLFFLACLFPASAHSYAQQTTDSLPRFPGGDSAWMVYCQKALLTKVEILKDNHEGGDIDAEFMVEKDGVVDDIKLIKRAGNRLDYFFEDILRTSPKWLPATHHGKPVSAHHRVHFSIDPDSLPDVSLDSLLLVESGDTVSTGPKIMLLGNHEVDAGRLVNWKRTGWWTYYKQDTCKAAQFEYEDGIPLEKREYDSKGKLVADLLVPDKVTTFPGGNFRWSEFVRKEITARISELAESDANGTIELGFWVDTSGAVSQVTALWPTGTALDKIAIEIVQNSPAWTPATTGGIPVRDYGHQWISFRQPPK